MRARLVRLQCIPHSGDALRPRHVAGILLGLAGAVALLGGGAVSLSLAGVSLAFASGLSWALYCLFRLKWAACPGPVLARGCAISTVLCAGLHLLLERSVIPSLGAAAAAAAIGVIPLALGNLAWDEGFRRGDSRRLAVLAYATPLCSAALLVALGLEPLTLNLVMGGLIIVLAGFLSRS